MKTYKLYRENGNFFAFEIENAYIRPKKIAKLLTTVESVTDVKVCGLLFFNAPEDVHVRFKYQNKNMIVWEPYGDNSRYWIGAEQDNDVIDITLLELAFEKYQPPVACKIFGDIITLNIKSLFNLK